MSKGEWPATPGRREASAEQSMRGLAGAGEAGYGRAFIPSIATKKPRGMLKCAPSKAWGTHREGAGGVRRVLR
ncbi:hypothetical protein GCM10007937_23850 [Mesorhizobium albiziae]|nr:hypothetical protein GCM10007937_23850 [Mesorhizobium albiziae]